MKRHAKLFESIAMPISKIDAIDRIEALRALPSPLKKRIAEQSGLQRIGEGATLFREGDRADFVYAIVSGHVALVSGIDGTETIADFMGAGSIVLIAPALLDLPYMVTGKATVEVLALLIPAGQFRKMAHEEVAFSELVAVTLARHWRLLMAQLKQVKVQDIDTRLAQFFIEQSGKAAGAAQMTLPSTKRELAAHLGVTPETLSRSLHRMRVAGVRTKGRDISIPSIERLTQFARRSHSRTASKRR